MSEDIREAVLARLLALAREINDDESEPLFKTIERNKIDLNARDLPQFVMLDGDEAGDSADPVRTGRGGRQAPRRVEMNPQFFFCVQNLAERAGSDLNECRRRWLAAVFSDEALFGLLGENGYIHYVETVVSFKIGRQLDATMLVSISFGYILRPTAL